MVDQFLFGILPYMAIVVAVVGGIWRFRRDRFSYSSLSSQFLEGRRLFWGSVPWHYGIILVLLGHLVGVLFPKAVTAFNGVPIRLYILEGTGLAMGLLLLMGLVLLVVRRLTNPLVRSVTSRMDLVLLIILLVSAVTGIGTAIFERWGSSWYVQTVTPYFWSLVRLNPNVEYMASLPVLTKIHAVTASVLVVVFPFTRLVHIVSVPFAYLWRPYQVVMWRRRRLRQ